MLLPLIVVVAFLSHFLLFGLTQHYCAKRCVARVFVLFPLLLLLPLLAPLLLPLRC